MTLSVLANGLVPHWWATTPLFTIAISLPAIFLGRNYIGRTFGVLLALAGSIWFVYLAVR